MGRVKSDERCREAAVACGGASARPDVDRVEPPELAREAVLAADQEQLVWVRILRAEAILAGQNAYPQGASADRDRSPLPPRRQFLVGPAVVLSNSRISAQQRLGEHS